MKKRVGSLAKKAGRLLHIDYCVIFFFIQKSSSLLSKVKWISETLAPSLSFAFLRYAKLFLKPTWLLAFFLPFQNSKNFFIAIIEMSLNWDNISMGN